MNSYQVLESLTTVVLWKEGVVRLSKTDNKEIQRRDVRHVDLLTSQANNVSLSRHAAFVMPVEACRDAHGTQEIPRPVCRFMLIH